MRGRGFAQQVQLQLQVLGGTLYATCMNVCCARGTVPIGRGKGCEGGASDVERLVAVVANDALGAVGGNVLRTS